MNSSPGTNTTHRFGIFINASSLKRTGYTALLLCILSGCTGGPVTINTEEPIQPAKLTLEGANGQNHCTLDFKNADYVFKGNNHCDNDEAIAIELEHVPSASNILLFDDYECVREIGGNYFWLYLRTIKENVTVAPIDLDEIMTWPKGTVIRPGVLVVDYARKNYESTKQRTSCVKIQVDAPPMP